MANRSILDTDILSEYLKRHNAIVTRRAAAYAEEFGAFTLTSITVYEILHGLERKGATAQLRRVLAWLEKNEEVTPIAADYRSGATMKAAAGRAGSIVELPDCLIAAVAVRLRRPLVTGNTEDFLAIQRTGISLALDNWREATTG